MATITAKRFFQVQLTNAFVTEYTVPASTTSIIKEIVICNTGTVVRQFFFSLVPVAGAAGAANAEFNSVDMAPNETKQITLSSVMNAGDFISAKASANTDLTMTCSGVEIT
jgi:hypothetical protein